VVRVGAPRRLIADHGEIKSLHTAEAARGRGVGSAMVRHIIAAARASGMTRLSLQTGSWAYFLPARALYARHGFVDCGAYRGERGGSEQRVHDGGPRGGRMSWRGLIGTATAPPIPHVNFEGLTQAPVNAGPFVGPYYRGADASGSEENVRHGDSRGQLQRHDGGKARKAPARMARDQVQVYNYTSSETIKEVMAT
jgi:predicted GNAT family acetyltransferase